MVEHHYGFYYQDPSKLSAIFTPKLLRLLQKNHQCSKDGVCVFDADPWTNTQDGEIVPPYEFTPVSHSVKRSAVRVSFGFNTGVSKLNKEVLLSFERTSGKKCWMLADFKGSSGKPISKMIADYFSH